MISRVPLPYLILIRVCGWLVLLGRSTAAKNHRNRYFVKLVSDGMGAWA